MADVLPGVVPADALPTISPVATPPTISPATAARGDRGATACSAGGASRLTVSPAPAAGPVGICDVLGVVLGRAGNLSGVVGHRVLAPMVDIYLVYGVLFLDPVVTAIT